MKSKDIIYIIPLSLALGAWFASVQAGNWWIGFASFSFLTSAGLSACFRLSFTLLKLSTNWGASSTGLKSTIPPLNATKTLTWIVALAFALRLLFGVSLHLGLPVYGHQDEDDKAGYVFTDAHLRDNQAWKLASSDRPILDEFSKKFASDQYGGLLAFSAFVYRYLSPDAQRPLMLILLSAFVAALGVPFLWLGTRRVFGEKVAFASAWIFALYPESILLGSSAMREPYLLTFSALVLYGFVFGVNQLADEGGNLAGSRMYTSLADTDEVIDDALDGFEDVLKSVEGVVRPKSWTLGIINSRGPKKERTDEETSQVHS